MREQTWPMDEPPEPPNLHGKLRRIASDDGTSGRRVFRRPLAHIRARTVRSPLIHAFSEILVSPPAVEILRVDETPAPAP